ncbi:cytochrome b/b6 domain-containing protein [Piscinibacter koreensis]|uniref:Cytochrome b/b6 domain-containing protein n=1 Tax=Piscinibacter koreensis TaxID=2742824 RepID=A0A7Y6NLG9_9BURK|nr:cytochrome b/b6 domain-containing protein [Schlegelella koreensis]NUZ05325.1 cytochrome b/b6 domain-containing protein [Schlegelella koreensis]
MQVVPSPDTAPAGAPPAPRPQRVASMEGAPTARRFYRHRLPVRVMHWINVVCLAMLLMSGLTIFNAHPALYWGRDSNFADPWLALSAERRGDEWIGVTTLGDRRFVTDGVLGVSMEGERRTVRGFPAWATVPSGQWLSMGRLWHFFFAWIFVVNGIAYVLYTVFSGHLRRDLLPTRTEWRGIGRSIWDHVRFRHPTGDAARRYNVLQNTAYLVVIFGLLPLVVIAGLAMSPRLDALWPGWVDLLGGRQSARSLHFLAAVGLVVFVAIHVFEVLVSGVWNQLRSMVTGWYTLPADRHGEAR